jgi:prophage regulatory protein
MATDPAVPPSRFIRWAQVKAIVGLSKATIRRFEQEDKFPRRRKIGHRAVGWLEADVLAWVKDRAGAGMECEQGADHAG